MNFKIVIPSNDAIEERCDDLRMAMFDLASNGANDEDYERVREHLKTLALWAETMSRVA